MDKLQDLVFIAMKSPDLFLLHVKVRETVLIQIIISSILCYPECKTFTENF